MTGLFTGSKASGERSETAHLGQHVISAGRRALMSLIARAAERVLSRTNSSSDFSETRRTPSLTILEGLPDTALELCQVVIPGAEVFFVGVWCD